jgi:hypothetical protein
VKRVEKEALRSVRRLDTVMIERSPDNTREQQIAEQEIMAKLLAA